MGQSLTRHNMISLYLYNDPMRKASQLPFYREMEPELKTWASDSAACTLFS